MEKIKEKIHQGRDYLSHRIDSDDLEPGDHIYVYRVIATYSHHGIYIGEGYVIHYNPTESKEGVKPKPPCPKCGHQEGVHRGVLKTCLKCFRSIDNNLLGGHALHRYRYGEPPGNYKIKKAGSCSTLQAKPPDEVIKTAIRLHTENSFGEYDLLHNNCESFATFCKTGIAHSAQVEAAEEKPVAKVATTMATLAGVGATAVAVGSTALVSKIINNQK